MEKIKILGSNRINDALFLLPEKNQMPNVLFTVYHYFTCAAYIISHNTYILKVDYPYFPFSSVKPMQWIDYNNRYNAQRAYFVL